MSYTKTNIFPLSNIRQDIPFTLLSQIDPINFHE